MQDDKTTSRTPLGAIETAELLQELLSRLDSTSRGIAIFDLDSTLLHNAPRQAAILREYGEQQGMAELAASRSEHWTSWEVADAMRASGLAEELVRRHRDPFKAYWREKFFTSEYCVLDEEIAGASTFVQAVREVGGRVFYVTGRHEEMRRGSVQCFERLGFPVPDEDEVRLIMKPTLDEEDDDYKARTYAVLRELGEVVCAFDNEPTHINGYFENFPTARSVHLATDDSGRGIPVLEGILSIPNFLHR